MEKYKKIKEKLTLHLILKIFYLIFVHLIKILFRKHRKSFVEKNTAKGLMQRSFDMNFLQTFPLYYVWFYKSHKNDGSFSIFISWRHGRSSKNRNRAIWYLSWSNLKLRIKYNNLNRMSLSGEQKGPVSYI